MKQLLSNFKSIQVFLKQFLEMQITSSLYKRKFVSLEKENRFLKRK